MKRNLTRKLFRAAALSALFGTALAPVADAAGFGGASFHAGASVGGGFHGGFSGGGFHSGGGTGFHESGVRPQRLELRDDGVKPTVDVRDRDRDRDRDGHHNGHWRNGVWIWDYDINAYDDAWNYYCDPASPGYDPAYCSGD